MKVNGFTIKQGKLKAASIVVITAACGAFFVFSFHPIYNEKLYRVQERGYYLQLQKVLMFQVTAENCPSCALCQFWWWLEKVERKGFVEIMFLI